MHPFNRGRPSMPPAWIRYWNEPTMVFGELISKQAGQVYWSLIDMWVWYEVAWTGHHGHGKLQTGIQCDVCVKNYRACSGQAISSVPDRQWVVTALSVHNVEAWMSASRLCLNPSKTVVLWLGSWHVIDKLDVHEVQVLSSTIKFDSSARDLGVVVDSRLTMSDHVVSVCHSAYYYLWQIRPIVTSLTVDTARTLV